MCSAVVQDDLCSITQVSLVITLKYFDGVNDQVEVCTAVREQLGLRLEAQRRPVQVIVIDHIERPTD